MNCYLFLFWNHSYPSHCPVALDVAALGGVVRVEVVCGLHAVLVGDLVPSTLDTGLEVELVVPVHVRSLGGLLNVNMRVGLVVVAVGVKRHVDVVLLESVKVLFGRAELVADKALGLDPDVC